MASDFLLNMQIKGDKADLNASELLSTMCNVLCITEQYVIAV